MGTRTSGDDRRIARNTLFLYFRQMLAMGAGLYTVRVVLSALGEEDYGIYSVVGGFVAMFNIVSGSLSIAAGRFITYEMGLPDASPARLRLIFSSSLVIQAAMGVAVCVLACTFGAWFVGTRMVIPAGRLPAAWWVLAFSSLSFVSGLLAVPYNALIIAHERMKAFAYVGVAESFMKLGVACLVAASSRDRLPSYAFCMLLVSLSTRGLAAAYCKRHFAECRFVRGFDRRVLSGMFAFSGWAFLGNGVILLKDQGGNMLLNLFGGPAANAAQGIAAQVNGAAYSFVSNFMTAAGPQITKSFSGGDLEAMHSLIIRSGKFGFFILLAVLLPLCANADYVLGLWLPAVPAHTANFVALVLLYSLLQCLATPLVTGVLAEGDIKPYEIRLTFIYAANFLASWACLRSGLPFESVFVTNIAFKAAALAALVAHSRRKYAFPVGRYAVECLFPSLSVFCACALLALAVPGKGVPDFGVFAARALFMAASVAAAAFALGMTRGERRRILEASRRKAAGILRRRGT